MEIFIEILRWFTYVGCLVAMLAYCTLPYEFLKEIDENRVEFYKSILLDGEKDF